MVNQKKLTHVGSCSTDMVLKSKVVSICSYLCKWGTSQRYMTTCHGVFRWTKFSSHEITKFSFHTMLCVCSEDPLWGWGVRGEDSRCVPMIQALVEPQRPAQSSRGAGPLCALSSCSSWVFASKDCIFCLVQTC